MKYLRYSCNPAWLLVFLCFSCFKKENPQNNIEIHQAEGPNPWTNLNWNNKSENFQFVVVTDRTGGNRPGVFEQGMDKINLLQPEFVVSVGDLIQGYTDDTVELIRQWEEFDRLVDGLEMPFFYVPGNHDITNRVMEDLWAQRYGRTYYHFVYRNVLFLCLNSEEPVPGNRDPGEFYETRDFYLSEQQRSYIRETLQNHTEVRWTFLFWHKPVWLHEESDDANREEEVARSGWKEVESLLKGRKHTVFAGHIHRYVHRQRNNSDYITLATTGGGSPLAGPIFGQFDHVLWVTMTDEGPVMANLMLDGIFDKDFQKDDIENHLALTMQNKVLRVDNKLDTSIHIENHIVKLTLFNNLDNQVESLVEFENSDHITFSNNSLSSSIPPNSVVSLEVEMSVEVADSIAWDEIRGEINRQYARWSLSYDYQQYGKIEVSGNSRLFP